MEEHIILEQVVNLETIGTLELGNVLESTTLSWEHTLIVSQFEKAGEIYSWILNKDDTQLVVKKPTRELVSEFAASNDIFDYQMRVLAELQNFDHGIPCVSGEYQLVPTRNKRSKNTTWVMAHHVATKGVSADDQLLTIMFKNGTSVKLDIAESKFNTTCSRSLDMGSMQVAEDRQYNISHGTTKEVQSQWGCPNLDESGHHTEEHNKRRIWTAMLIAIMRIWYKTLFGENMSQPDIDKCLKAIQRPFGG